MGLQDTVSFPCFGPGLHSGVDLHSLAMWPALTDQDS